MLYQGPFTDQLKNHHLSEDFNLMISGWQEDRRNLEAIAQGGNRVVVLSRRPLFSGPSNLSLQQASTLAGLRRIMKLAGPDALVLKIRSDFEVYPLNRALEVLRSEWLRAQDKLSGDPQGINWPNKNPMKMSFWIEVSRRCFGYTQARHPVLFYDYSWHKKGYFLDFMQFGRCEDLLNLWSIKRHIDVFSTGAPETHLTARFRKKFNVGAPGRSHIASSLFFRLFHEEGIQVHWSKTGATQDNWKGHGLWSSASQFNEK